MCVWAGLRQHLACRERHFNKVRSVLSHRLPLWSKFMTLVLSQAGIFSVKGPSLTKKGYLLEKAGWDM